MATLKFLDLLSKITKTEGYFIGTLLNCQTSKSEILEFKLFPLTVIINPIYFHTYHSMYKIADTAKYRESVPSE